MKLVFKIALIAVSLLLSVGPGFAADVKAPAPNSTGAATAVKQGVKGAAAEVAAPAKATLVDINTATEAELKAVPGIGNAYAAKIIAGRPYANKAQLKSRKIMPKTVYEQVKDKIIARMPKK
jgi:competence protein ComEA